MSLIMVLCVDDEPALLEICQIFLEKTGGFSVSPALSGKDALALLDSRHFDVIVADYQMSGMDGIELLKQVRERDAAIPFILFTGKGREEVVIEAINNGADFYLQKGGDPRVQFVELQHKILQAVRRRTAEIQVKESEEWLRSFIEQTVDAVHIIDEEGRIVEWNPAAERLFGIQRLEALGQLSWDVQVRLLQDDGRGRERFDQIKEKIQASLASGIPVFSEGEFTIQRTDGNQISIRQTVFPIRTARGFRFGSITRNISEYKQTVHELQGLNRQIAAKEAELKQKVEEMTKHEKTLAESRQLLQSILDTVPVRVFWKDTALEYLGCNIAFAKDSGFKSPEDLIGRSDYDMAWAEQADLYRADDRAVIESGIPRLNYEEPQTTPDGRRTWLRTSKIPLRDTDGNIRGILGTYEDITAEKEALAEIQALAQFPARSPHPVMQADNEGVLLYANEASGTVLDQLGIAKGALLPEAWLEKIRAVRNTGSHGSFEITLRETIYTATIAPVPGERFFNLYLIDITGRKNAEDAVARRNEELQAAYGQLSAADTALRENYRILKEQQATLQGNEEKYRNLFEAESDAILLIDNTTGNILEANNAASLLYGFGHDELLRMKNADLSAEPEQTTKTTKETPVIYDQVVTIPLRFHRKRDGTIFPVEITGRFFVWEGHPVHIAAIRDISGRYEAEKSIKQQKERAVRHQRALIQLATTDAPTLRNALNRVTETGAGVFGIERVSIWFISAKGDMLICNDLYIRSRQVHESGTGILVSDCPRYFTGLWESRAIVAPDARSHELTAGLSQKYLIPLNIISVLSIPIRSGKDVIGVLSFEEVGTVREWDLEEQDFAGALADYTAIVLEQARRQLAEKDLKKSEEKYRAVVDRASDGIVIIQEGVFCFINPKAAEIFGSAADDIIGTHFLDLIAPGERQKVQEKSARRMAGEAVSAVYETTVTRKNNQMVDIEINGSIITFEGKPADLVFIRDISDRKRSEGALRLANQKLHLLSSVTRHDILNKLTLVMGYFEMARMTDDPEKQEDFIRKIDANLQIMEDQIQFTRDYQDMGVKDPEWQDAAAVFARAVSQLETGSVRIVNELECLTVYTDPLLSKVFYNIVDNSLRYGTKVTAITAGFTLSGDSAVLTISDDGVGIPSNDKARIFEKGYGQHTGLGLFLAREILSLTGIEIMETGFPGKGARFEIHIPAARFRIRDRNSAR